MRTTIEPAAAAPIRHEIDFVLYRSERERGESERHPSEAVDYAFAFAQAWSATRARA